MITEKFEHLNKVKSKG